MYMNSCMFDTPSQKPIPNIQQSKTTSLKYLRLGSKRLKLSICNECSVTTMGRQCQYPPLLISKKGKRRLCKNSILIIPSHDCEVMVIIKVHYENKSGPIITTPGTESTPFPLNALTRKQRYNQGSINFYHILKQIYFEYFMSIHIFFKIQTRLLLSFNIMIKKVVKISNMELL